MHNEQMYFGLNNSQKGGNDVWITIWNCRTLKQEYMKPPPFLWPTDSGFTSIVSGVDGIFVGSKHCDSLQTRSKFRSPSVQGANGVNEGRGANGADEGRRKASQYSFLLYHVT